MLYRRRTTPPRRVDGEAGDLSPSLRFAIPPLALWARISARHSGAPPSALHLPGLPPVMAHLLGTVGVIVLRTDWRLATLGRVALSLWMRISRGRRPVTGLDKRLLAERDTIRAVLGKNWRQAALLTTGRLGFDYACLLAALRAIGASPQPSLVLLAYSAAGIVALFPGTPGGLGIVEAL